MIVVAESTRAMNYATLEADAVYLALMAGGVSSILPRARLDPATAPTPFTWIRFEGVGAGGDDMDRLMIAFEVHDRPGFGYWKIDRAIDRIKWMYNHKVWPVPTGSTERPRRSSYAGATGELIDQGWNTIKRVARIAIITS